MIVALDVGLKRIGVAIAVGNLILPSDPILRKNREFAAAAIRKMLCEKKCDRLVVGIPKGGSSEEEMSRRIRHFVNLINFGGIVEFVDESFSSHDAAGLVKDRRDGKFDSVAACEILRRYLAAHPPATN